MFAFNIAIGMGMCDSVSVTVVHTHVDKLVCDSYNISFVVHSNLNYIDIITYSASYSHNNIM